MQWPLAFYHDEKGRCPAQQFLDSIPVSQRAKVFQRLQMLAEWGPRLPFPYSSQVEGALRELRAHYGRVQYRVLYYADRNRVFVLLHAFLKKTEEIPDADKKVALQRMRTDEQMKGG